MNTDRTKEELFEIIEKYLAKGIDSGTFSDEYHRLYNIELDYTILSDMEHKILYDLSDIASRFNEFEEDRKALPNYFVNEEELRTAVSDGWQKLKGQKD